MREPIYFFFALHLLAAFPVYGAELEFVPLKEPAEQSMDAVTVAPAKEDSVLKKLTPAILQKYLGRYKGRWPNDAGKLIYDQDFIITLEEVNETGIFANTVTISYKIDGGNPLKRYMKISGDRLTDKLEGSLMKNPDSLELYFYTSGKVEAVMYPGLVRDRQKMSTFLRPL